MAILCHAQKPAKEGELDTAYTDYEALFNDMDALLDSLTAPRDFVLCNLAVSRNAFSYESKSSYLLTQARRITYAPSLSFFSKKGWGIGGTAVVVNDGQNINPFQGYVTGSYDYLKDRRFLTGIAYTRFFTKDSLPFYTSPLKNEVYGYFAYRRFWLKPSVSLSYGWGARSDYSERADYITSLRLQYNGFTRVNTRESISDFNLTSSVRHDFYWIGVLGKADYVRLTPQLVFTAGTQRFGFNQNSSTYATLPRTGVNVLYSADQIYLDDQLYFQPLSLSAYLKTEYSVGKIFVQPQLVLDYYFPAADKNFTTAFILNAGVIF